MELDEIAQKVHPIESAHDTWETCLCTDAVEIRAIRSRRALLRELLDTEPVGPQGVCVYCEREGVSTVSMLELAHFPTCPWHRAHVFMSGQK